MNERRHSRFFRPATPLLLVAALLLPLHAAPLQDRRDDRKETDKKKEPVSDAYRTVEVETREASWISLDVAPDGRTLVFELLGDLYSLPIAGGVATRITSGLRSDSQPRFSPDGARIVFLSDRSGDENIWLANRDGSDPKPLTSGKDTQYWSPEWTPDGKYIIVSRSGGTGGSELWLYEVDGTGGVTLTGEERGHGGYGGHEDAGKNDRTELSEGRRQINPLGPAFGKDGRFVYYTERTSAARAYNELPIGWQLGVYDRQTGENFRMSDDLGSAMRPVLSPDGRWLVYATRWDAQTGFRVRDLKSGEDAWLIYPVTRDDQESPSTRDLMPGSSFTPDSRALITSFAGQIWRVDVPSGEATPIPFTARVPQKAADR